MEAATASTDVLIPPAEVRARAISTADVDTGMAVASSESVPEGQHASDPRVYPSDITKHLVQTQGVVNSFDKLKFLEMLMEKKYQITESILDDILQGKCAKATLPTQEELATICEQLHDAHKRQSAEDNEHMVAEGTKIAVCGYIGITCCLCTVGTSCCVGGYFSAKWGTELAHFMDSSEPRYKDAYLGLVKPVPMER